METKHISIPWILDKCGPNLYLRQADSLELLGSLVQIGKNGVANAELIVNAVNQYEALGLIAIAAGELLLAKNHDNAEKLHAALEQLAEIRNKRESAD